MRTTCPTNFILIDLSTSSLLDPSILLSTQFSNALNLCSYSEHLL